MINTTLVLYFFSYFFIELSYFSFSIRSMCFFFQSFCGPYVSNQKPHVENINKQIRKFFPKGKSIDYLTKKDILNKNITLLNTPKDAFKSVYGEDLFYKIFAQIKSCFICY